MESRWNWLNEWIINIMCKYVVNCANNKRAALTIYSSESNVQQELICTYQLVLKKTHDWSVIKMEKQQNRHLKFELSS